MRFSSPLLMGRLVRRYKRFLADVILESGEQVTAYCPNTGRMTACNGEGWPVALSDSGNERRKHRLTLEMVHNGVCWIGVNTGRTNRIAGEAIQAGRLPSLAGYDVIEYERPYGEHCRIDILLLHGEERCYVEVKNTTLVDEEGYYAFPDAVTARGTKHLRALSSVCGEGHRAAVLYLIQRSDGARFRPAAAIDPVYAAACSEAAAAGVEMIALRAAVSPESIEAVEEVPVELPQNAVLPGREES